MSSPIIWMIRRCGEVHSKTNFQTENEHFTLLKSNIWFYFWIIRLIFTWDFSLVDCFLVLVLTLLFVICSTAATEVPLDQFTKGISSFAADFYQVFIWINILNVLFRMINSHITQHLLTNLK